MHHDAVTAKVDQAHRDLIEYVLTGQPREGGNGHSAELRALVAGERGPGVQEVVTAMALAELARQVGNLTEKVCVLEATKDAKTPTPTRKGR